MKVDFGSVDVAVLDVPTAEEQKIIEAMARGRIGYSQSKWDAVLKKDPSRAALACLVALEGRLPRTYFSLAFPQCFPSSPPQIEDEVELNISQESMQSMDKSSMDSKAYQDDFSAQLITNRSDIKKTLRRRHNREYHRLDSWF